MNIQQSGVIFIAKKHKSFLAVVASGVIALSVVLFTFFRPGIPQQTAIAQTQNMSVSIQNMQFTPGIITIAAGTTVVWTNNDSVPHTITSDTGIFDSGTLSPGQSVSMTFSSPGTYTYHCNIHPFMHGTVQVVTSITPTPTTMQMPYQKTTYIYPPGYIEHPRHFIPPYQYQQPIMYPTPQIYPSTTPTPTPTFTMPAPSTTNTTQNQSQNQINNNNQSVNVTVTR